MKENPSINPDVFVEKKIDYGQQIASILQDKNPIDRIHSIVSASFTRSKKETKDDLLEKIKSDPDHDAAKIQLLYFCLPTIDTVLQKYKNLGESQEDLVTVAFETELGVLNKFKDNSLLNASLLRIYLNRDIKFHLEKHLCLQHDIDQKHFPFLPIFYQIKDDFERDYGRGPRLQDWSLLKENIDQYLQTLNPEEQQFFQENRYHDLTTEETGEYTYLFIYRSLDWRLKNDMFSKNDRDSKTSKIDLFYLIARKALINEKENSLLSSPFNQDEIINQTIIKDTIKKVREKLDSREKKVLDCYFQEYQQNDIAKLIGVSNMLVGIIEKKIKSKIIKELKQNYHFLDKQDRLTLSQKKRINN